MFRFTIRDVLWLTVVVALALALWIDRRLVLHQQAKAIQLWTARANAAADVLVGDGWQIEWDDSKTKFRKSGKNSLTYPTETPIFLYRTPDKS